jgi:hypothetical protein
MEHRFVQAAQINTVYRTELALFAQLDKHQLEEHKLNVLHAPLDVQFVQLLMERKYAQIAYKIMDFPMEFVLNALLDKHQLEGKLNV